MDGTALVDNPADDDDQGHPAAGLGTTRSSPAAVIRARLTAIREAQQRPEPDTGPAPLPWDGEPVDGEVMDGTALVDNPADDDGDWR
jgi:hypothetical protein